MMVTRNCQLTQQRLCLRLLIPSESRVLCFRGWCQVSSLDERCWISELALLFPAPTAIHPLGATSSPKTHPFVLPLHSEALPMSLLITWSKFLNHPKLCVNWPQAATQSHQPPASSFSPVTPDCFLLLREAFSGHSSVLAVLFHVPHWTLPFPRVAFSDPVLQMCLKYSLPWKHFLTPQSL